MNKLFYSRMIVLLSMFSLLSFCYSNNKDNIDIAVTINKYQKITPAELLNKADYFVSNNVNDSAMICYSLIYNTNVKSNDTAFKQIVCKAMNKASRIYFYHCNYKLALDLLLKAMEICEEINYTDYIGYIYNNMGNVYYQFKDLKQAKRYYELAYRYSSDSNVLRAALNNLGMLAHDAGKLDSALILYKKSYVIKKTINDSFYNEALNNIGLIHQALNNYDSAFFYYFSALRLARKFKLESKEATILSNLGPLHFELHNRDSAIYYLNLSNAIADNIKLFDIMSGNYRSLSVIEEKNGNMDKAFNYYKKYSAINDSLFNATQYGGITELQFGYNMSKIDKQIKELNLEQEMKEKTIFIQRILQFVMGLVLMIVITFFILLYVKNRTLNNSYNTLVAKNIEIVNLDRLNQQIRKDYEQQLKENEKIIKRMRKELSRNGEKQKDVATSTKYSCSSLSDDSYCELANAILEVMSDKNIFCDVDFSLNKLASIIGSNQTYISQVINDSFNSNFRTFINEYRVKEARKMLSEPEYRKYSLESISIMVGFKSKSTFNIAFKEVTGVTPSFYIHSLKMG